MSGKMFTGYNSNIEHDGKLFHVQTEDKGLGNPIVETLVFSGGEVIAAVQNSYADLAESPDYSQVRIRERMRRQHQRSLDDLELGRLQQEAELRYRIDAPDLSYDNLIDEVLEDWIDTTAATETVLKVLEHEIDLVRRRDADQRHRLRQRKQQVLIGAALLLLAVAAAFEFGRLSRRAESLEPAVESQFVPSAAQPRSVPALDPPVAPPEPLAVAEEADTPIEIEPTPPAADQPEPRATRPAPRSDPMPPAIVESKTPPVVTVAPAVVETVLPPEPLQLAAETMEVAPPPAAPVVDRIYEVGEIDEPPTSLPTQLPVYTQTALRRSLEGGVWLNVLVGEDGRIDAVRVVDELTDSELIRSAISAVLHWRFKPGFDRGQPVRVWLPVHLEFKLSRNGMHGVVTIAEH